jgi:acyl carrier protein
MHDEKIYQSLIRNIAELSGMPANELTPETGLIGNESVLDSRGLVELMLAIEEFLEDDFGTRFDWVSDSAMSSSRSNFRSIGTLYEMVREQVGK